MNHCTPRDLTESFYLSPEFDALCAKGATVTQTEWAGIVHVDLRLFLWPMAVAGLLHERLGVRPADVDVPLMARVLFELLPDCQDVAPEQTDELIEELRAYYAFLARTQPRSSAPAVLAFLQEARTARRFGRAVLRRVARSRRRMLSRA